MRAWRIVLVIFMTLGLLATGWITWHRVQWESQYRDVGAMVSLSQLVLLAQSENVDLDAALARLRTLEITILSLTPWEIKDWQKTVFRLPPWLLSPDLRFPTISFSFDELDALKRKGFGLALVLQPESPTYLKNLPELFAAIEASPFKYLYFAGNPIWGWPNELQTLSNWLTQHMIDWGAVEFAEPVGASEVLGAGARHYARLHQIKQEEMAELSVQQALERWERGVVERNIRVLNINLWPTSLASNWEYLSVLRSRIIKAGFSWQWPTQIESMVVQPWSLILLGLGLSSLLTFGLLSWLPVSVAWSIMGWLVLSAAILVGLWSQLPFFGQTLALILATVGPVIVYVMAHRWWNSSRSPWFRATCGLFFVSLVSLILGTLTAALLSNEFYFLKLEEFQGVRLALILPLILIFLAELTRLGWSHLFVLGRRPLRIVDVLILGVGLAGLAMIFLRSGNFSILPVSESEQATRSMLEDWFQARPRFKEFLLGHPLLFLWSAVGREKWGFYGPFVTAGAWVGQVSIINTFEHLHSPWVFSVLRTTNGLVLGILLGICAYALWQGGNWIWTKLNQNKS